jgi:hypothetical protein
MGDLPVVMWAICRNLCGRSADTVVGAEPSLTRADHGRWPRSGSGCTRCNRQPGAGGQEGASCSRARPELGIFSWSTRFTGGAHLLEVCSIPGPDWGYRSERVVELAGNVGVPGHWNLPHQQSAVDSGGAWRNRRGSSKKLVGTEITSAGWTTSGKLPVPRQSSPRLLEWQPRAATAELGDSRGVRISKSDTFCGLPAETARKLMRAYSRHHFADRP